MIAAKLRRSRDVPEHEPIKIKKPFRFRNLRMFKHGFLVAFRRGESVAKALFFQGDHEFRAGASVKTGAHIFSEMQTLRLQTGGIL
jgi:hypothetical protein